MERFPNYKALVELSSNDEIRQIFVCRTEMVDKLNDMGDYRPMSIEEAFEYQIVENLPFNLDLIRHSYSDDYDSLNDYIKNETNFIEALPN